MTVALPLVLFALAFCGAFVSGLVGVGGAIVMIPLLYYVPPLLGAGELTIKEVAGLSMTQVLAAALVGAWSHGRHAFVHRRLAVIGGSAMAAGALLGALLSSHVPGRALLATFAVMATLALLLMFVSPTEPTRADGDPAAVPFHRASAAGLPGVIGLAAGVVGAGGAFLLVPVMVGVMRIPLRLSIGTSLAMVGMSAIAGFLGKAMTGQVPLWPAATVVLGSLSGAPLGGRVSRRVPVPVLRAVLVGIIIVVMLRVWLDVATH